MITTIAPLVTMLATMGATNFWTFTGTMEPDAYWLGFPGYVARLRPVCNGEVEVLGMDTYDGEFWFWCDDGGIVSAWNTDTDWSCNLSDADAMALVKRLADINPW